MPQPATASLEFPTLTPVGRQAGAPTVLLTQSYVIAGSSSRASLRIESKSVSRFHCIIIRSGRDVFVRDLASRNGTYVNKNKISERTLHGGDVIHIGDRPFQFRRRGTRNLPVPPLPPTSKLTGDDWPGANISGKTLLIGRREGCDVLLDSDDVAPAHAIIFAMDSAHHLLDLHSPTGTRLNGAAIKTAMELSPGDEIEIAGSVMRYEPLGTASKKDALEDSDALIPIDFHDEDESPAAAAPPAKSTAAINAPVAAAPAPTAETSELAEEVEEEPFSLADLRDLGGIPAEPAVEEIAVPEPVSLADEAPIPLADEDPAPIPSVQDEAENNPIVEESPAPLAGEPIVPFPHDLDDPSTAPGTGVSPVISEPDSSPNTAQNDNEMESSHIAEEPIAEDIDDLALAALNESSPEVSEAPPATEAEAPREAALADDVPPPAEEIIPSSPFELSEPAATASSSPPEEIRATINAPPVPSEESLTQALAADAAMDAVLPVDLPEVRTEAAAIADAEEEIILENDGAVAMRSTDLDEANAPADSTDSPQASGAAIPGEGIIQEVSEFFEAPAPIDRAVTDEVVASPVEMHATFPPETVIEPLTESAPEPIAEFPVGEPPAPPAAAIDFSDFNTLIDSLGQEPPGVPVSQSSAPPPAVTSLSSTEIARAMRADLGGTALPEPIHPAPAPTSILGPSSTPQLKPVVTDRTIPPFICPGPATQGKVTVGFEMSSPPARQEDVFALTAKESIWKVPPDPGFGIASPGTVAGASSSRSVPEPPKLKPDHPRQAAESQRQVAPRRAKRLWIFILLIGAAVVFWSQHRWHSAGELPPAQSPAHDDAESASMRQLPQSP